MGQAKQKAMMRQKWLASLDENQTKIFQASENLYRKFLVPAEATGMCYRMTFFLRLYLDQQGVETIPVVGFVNDGTDDFQISHAWLEYAGQKVDLTLGKSERPELNPEGQVLILDEIYKGGHVYSYSLEKTAAAIAIEREGMKSPFGARVVVQKADEHAFMANLANDVRAMRQYLDAAPDRITFEKLRDIIEN